MKRNTFNFVIDFISLAVMWGLLSTGLLIKYVLPPGSGHWLAVQGMNRHDWGEIHFYLAVAVCVLVFVHVLLHWRWVCGTVRGFFAEGHVHSRPLRGVLGAAVVVLLALATGGLLVAANGRVIGVQPPLDGPGDRHGGGKGRMSRGGATPLPILQPRPSVDQHALPSRAHQDEGSNGPSHRHADTSHASPGHGREWTIRGSTALADAAAAKNMSVDQLRRQLGVPPEVPASETLGRLGRRYAFSILDVRALPDRVELKGSPTEAAEHGRCEPRPTR